MDRTVSAEESMITQDSESPPKKKTGEVKKEAGPTSLESPKDNYECSICLSWLRDPVLTTCGHRFCKSCLQEWRQKKNTKCPLDDMNLSIEDIFPDNFTKREIDNMRKSFPEQFDPPSFECNFATIACDFKSMDPEEVERHVKENYKEHMDLLLKGLLQSKFQSWDPLDKTGTDNPRELLAKMFERIVILEQKTYEQENHIKMQEVKIERLQQMETRRNGTLVWKIKDFQQKINQMTSNPQQMYYSPDCFTEPNGYKFCCRMALNTKRTTPNVLSFFVHFMKSENDYHLLWPFNGKIAISMINKTPSLTFRDIVMSNPKIKAFDRPIEDISTRSYGFTDYAEIAEIIRTGFITDDCLTIKIQVNIV